MNTHPSTTRALHRAVVRAAALVALAAVTAACGTATDATEEPDAIAAPSDEATTDDDATDVTTTADSAAATVTRIPTLTLAPPDRPGCGFPLASEDGMHVFVTHDDRLVRYDLTTGEVVDHGPVEGDCPGWIGDPEAGRKVVAAGMNGGTWLGPLDGDLDVRVDVDVPLVPLSRAIVGDRVVLGSPTTQSFQVHDATTGELVVKVPVPDGDFGLAFGSDGTHIGLTAETADGGGEAILLDAANGAELHRVEMGASAEESVFDLATGELLVPTTDGRLVTIDLSTGEIVSEVERSSTASVVAVGVRPDGMVVVATSRLLEVIDRSTGPTGVAAPADDALAMRVRPDGTVLRIGSEGDMEVIALEGTGPLLGVAPPD